MLAVVKMPRIEVRIRGQVPQRLLRCLKLEFGKNLRIKQEEDEKTVDFFSTDIFKEAKKTMSPDVYVKIYRENRDLTQQDLGKLLGVSKAFVCDIEKDRRPISKKMAKKLAEIFEVSPARFI
jgi:DNA-binding XRE family transcriptional regulator